MRVLTLSLLVINFLTAGVSYGQKDLRFSVNMLVDDNIYRNYKEKGDLVFIPQASLGYGFSSGDFNKFFLGYEGQLFFFNEMSYRDFSVHRFRANFNHLWPESQSLVALGGQVETRLNPEVYNYYNYTSGGFYLNYKTYVKDNAILYAKYNLNGKNFSEFPEFNYAENVFALQTNIFLATKTTLRLSANYYHKNYTSSVTSLDSMFVDPEISRFSPTGSPRGRGMGFGMSRTEHLNISPEVSEGFYWYTVRENEFPSTDQIKLGITVAQNLAERTGLSLGYYNRINPYNRNRYLTQLGESVLNNEELFDDHYSYIGHEGFVQLKTMLPGQSTLTLLLTGRQRKFSGRPALDLEGYYLDSGEDRLDKALLFEAEFTRNLSFGSSHLLNDYNLALQFGMGKNNSNDAYYDYKSAYFLFSMEKAF